jgi:hypothetical protein
MLRQDVAILSEVLEELAANLWRKGYDVQELVFPQNCGHSSCHIHLPKYIRDFAWMH